MKSFYEWLGERRSVERGTIASIKERKIKAETNDPDYQSPYFSRFLGEDDDSEEPFAVEVDFADDDWEARGPLWAREYVLNGSEPKAGNPVQESPGKVVFKTPGKKLENLPPALKQVATKWVNDQIDWHLDNFDPETEYYDYEYQSELDRRGRGR